MKFLRFTVFVSMFFLICLSVSGSVAGSAPAAASDDVAAKVICNVVVFVQRLGLPIMTGVILGASIMAIFGKMAWASIVVLVVFTAIFFGAGKLMQKFAAGLNNEFGDAKSFECKGEGKTTMPQKAQAAIATRES